MPRTIIVKGIGKVSASPDYVAISMNLETNDSDYEVTMELASKSIESLNRCLEQIGFEKKSIKTTNFNVRTDYDSIRDRNGNYKRVFRGYICNHSLKVSFDFDTKRLNQALNAISKCLVQPELQIAFTVKDPTAVNAELLKSATKNAKEKAEILCNASGVQLGELLSVDYNWSELNFVSHTKYAMCEDTDYMSLSQECNIDIEPDDIDVRDTATFVWEIK